MVIKTKSLPISATTFPTALSLYIAEDGRKHKHNPTLSAKKHVLQICRSSLSAAADGIERSLSRAVVIKTKSLPISATTFPTALSLYIAEDGRKHKHNPTLSAKKHVLQICRSSLSAAADGLADGSGERWTSPFNGDAQSWNGIERSLSRVVVPPSLPISATTFPTALSVYIAQGACERISAIPASCSQRQNRFHSKRKKTLTWSILLAWSMPTKWYWVIHGRLTSERKAYTCHRHSSITRPLPAARALKHQAPCTCLNSNAWTLDRLRTGRRVGSTGGTRRRGDHMHDHSRFQRDIEWRHRRLSLSLSLSQKSLTHNIGSASALPIINERLTVRP